MRLRGSAQLLAVALALASGSAHATATRDWLNKVGGAPKPLATGGPKAPPRATGTSSEGRARTRLEALFAPHAELARAIKGTPGSVIVRIDAHWLGAGAAFVITARDGHVEAWKGRGRVRVDPETGALVLRHFTARAAEPKDALRIHQASRSSGPATPNPATILAPKTAPAPAPTSATPAPAPRDELRARWGKL